MKGIKNHIQGSWDQQVTKDLIEMAMYFVGLLAVLYFGYQIKNGSVDGLSPIILAGLGTFLGAYSAFYLQNQHAKKVEAQTNINEINNCLILLRLKIHFVTEVREKHTSRYPENNIPMWARILPSYIAESNSYLAYVKTPSCLISYQPEVLQFVFNQEYNLKTFVSANNKFVTTFKNLVVPHLNSTGVFLTDEEVNSIDEYIKFEQVEYQTLIDSAKSLTTSLEDSIDSINSAYDEVKSVAVFLYPNVQFAPK